MNRSKVIETLDKLPTEFTTEELIDRLLFVDKVEQGMKEAEEGKVISFEEVKERMAKGLSSWSLVGANLFWF